MEGENVVLQVNRKIASNRMNVFGDSVSKSAACFTYISDITSFTYNVIHNFFYIQVIVSTTEINPLEHFSNHVVK